MLVFNADVPRPHGALGHLGAVPALESSDVLTVEFYTISNQCRHTQGQGQRRNKREPGERDRFLSIQQTAAAHMYVHASVHPFTHDWMHSYAYAYPPWRRVLC